MKARAGEGITKETLPNGLRVIIEPLREFSSVSVGVWALTGSRDEESHQSGISHLIEHLAFKGTVRRTAKEIALEIDSLGGSLNAFTGKEFTSFYAKVLGEHMPRAMDVLGDISLKSLFQQQDLHKEKDVILQEISMVEDTPDDLIHDLHCREFWAGQSLGRPVLGTPESLRAVERAHVVDYHTDRYQGDRMIITAAGALDPEVFLAEVSRTFGSLSSSGRPYLRPAPTATPRVYVQERQVEQVHFCAGYPGLRADDHRRYAMFLLNTLLGGGMSSRLFQKIREEYGLAYSVYSYHAAYQDTGMHAVYCGTSREGFAKALEIINDETRLLASERVGAEELTTGKRQLKGNLLLGLESTSNRMNQLARDEIFFGRHVPVEEIEEGIETVTADQIRDLAADLFRKEHMALTVIGPVSEDEVRRVRG